MTFEFDIFSKFLNGFTAQIKKPNLYELGFFNNSKILEQTLQVESYLIFAWKFIKLKNF